MISDCRRSAVIDRVSGLAFGFSTAAVPPRFPSSSASIEACSICHGVAASELGWLEDEHDVFMLGKALTCLSTLVLNMLRCESITDMSLWCSGVGSDVPSSTLIWAVMSVIDVMLIPGETAVRWGEVSNMSR